jgi:hypothetical protein
VLNRLNLLDEIDAAMFFAAWCQGTVPAGQRADLDATIDRVVGRFCGSAWMGDEDDLTGEAWAFVLDEMLAKWRPYVSGEGIGAFVARPLGLHLADYLREQRRPMHVPAGAEVDVHPQLRTRCVDVDGLAVASQETAETVLRAAALRGRMADLAASDVGVAMLLEVEIDGEKPTPVARRHGLGVRKAEPFR